MSLWSVNALRRTTALLLITPLILVGLLSLSPTIGVDFYSAGGETSLRWWKSLFSDPSWALAFAVSFTVAVGSMLVSLSISLPLATAWRISRNKIALVFIIIGGLVACLPPVVVALAQSSLLQWVGLFDTIIGVAYAHSTLSMPIVALLLLVRFEANSVSAFETSQALGASRAAAVLTWLMSEHRATVVGAACVGILISMSEATISIFVTDTQVEAVPRKALSGLTQNMDPTSFAALVAWLVAAAMISGPLDRSLNKERTL